MFPNVGQLTTYIEIEQPVTAEDGYGHKTTTWEKHTSTYAQKRYKSGNERFHSGQKQADARLEFWIYYDPSVREMSRINDCETGQYYDITFIARYRAEGWMKLEAQAKPTMAQGDLIGAGQ